MAKEKAQIVGVRQHATARGAPGEFEDVHVPLPPPRPGVYAVHLDGLPRVEIDTGIPAGPDAESLAAARYCERFGLVRRPGVEPVAVLLA